MERTNHTPKCLLILLAVATSLQADMSVEKWEATSKEIVLRYTAPDLNPCRVQASRVNDFGPAYQPVPDVDAALFPHSDLDSRNPALVRGQVRTFVLGQDIAERAVDGYTYSRALKAATMHYIKISCGNQITALSASTKSVPFGLTRGEAHPADPDNPGEYLHPSRKWGVANQKVVDPLSGVELNFPLAHGSGAVTLKTGVPFREAVSTAWTNPDGALKDDGLAATLPGNNSSSLLYLRWDYNANNIFGSGSLQDFDNSGLDSLAINLKGSGAAADPADRTVQLCLTVDGVSCLSPWWDTVLPASVGPAPKIGSGNIGDTLQQPGMPPFGRQRLISRAGQFTYTAASKTVNITSGGALLSWSPGTLFRAYGTRLVNAVRGATNTAPIVITLPGHGLQTGDAITISGVFGNTAANGSWTIDVSDTDHFTLRNSLGNGTFGTHTGIMQVLPGSPCKLRVDANQSWIHSGDVISVSTVPNGITGLTGDYTIAVGTESGLVLEGFPADYGYVLTLAGSSCAGTPPDARLYIGYINVYRGDVQPFQSYPIASVTNATSLVLQNGPASDIATPLDWAVEPFGVLIRKKTSSRPEDSISIEYATADYQLSPGFASKASGSAVCGENFVPGPGGVMGVPCIVGVPMWVGVDGTTSQFGVIPPRDELVINVYVYYGAGNMPAAFGINPNKPKAVYAMESWRGDRSLTIGTYEGDFSPLDPNKGQDYYYPHYLGYPYIPNCYGWAGDTATGKRLLPAGSNCVSYTLVAPSLKALIRNYGKQQWKRMNLDLDALNCAADVNSYGITYSQAHGKVQINMTCTTGQNTAGVAYVFEVDESVTPAVVTPVAEIASWDRDLVGWTSIHGGFGVKAYADGYVGWTPWPLNLGSDYKIGWGSVGPMMGPYETTYTAVDGVDGAGMSSALQSCAAWAGSPFLPTPAPDGVGKVNGFVAGCTRLKLASEPCDASPSPNEQAIMALDPQSHRDKCGAAGLYYSGRGLRPGDMLLFLDDDPNQFFAVYENARVIAVNGSGPGMEIAVYRGGVRRWGGSTYAGFDGARDYRAMNSRKILPWFNHLDSGPDVEMYVNYFEHPTDTGGGSWLFGFGHGNRTAFGVAGAGGALFGDFEVQKTKTTPDVVYTDVPQFNGKVSNNDYSVDTHVTWVPAADRNSRIPWLIDGRPWNGYNGVPGTAVAGTRGVYRWKQADWAAGDVLTAIYPKFLPLAVRAGTKVLRSVSGPGSAIDDSKPYTYCYAYAAGECRADAQKDDFYLSAPNLTTNAGVMQTSGQDQTGQVDPAFTSVTSIVSCYTQQLMENDPTGSDMRCLTTGFERYRQESSFKNWSITPDGRTGIGISTGLEGVRSEVWTAEMPSIQPDSWDRTKYIDWAVTVPPAANADSAVVDFGYARYGSDPANGKFYCMDRADNCVAGAGATGNNPFWFASETYNGVPCASGCTVHVPLVGNKVLYYRIRWLNNGKQAAVSEVRALATP